MHMYHRLGELFTSHVACIYLVLWDDLRKIFLHMRLIQLQTDTHLGIISSVESSLLSLTHPQKLCHTRGIIETPTTDPLRMTGDQARSPYTAIHNKGCIMI